MATITPVSVTTAGAAVPKSAASVGGDSIHSASGATLLVLNGSGSSITVTLAGAVACSQGSLHNTAITVAAGADEQVKVPSQCVDPTTGYCAVTYSAVTTVTVAATAA